MAAARKKKIIRRKSSNAVCFFCDQDKTPDYKEYKVLARFVSDRAKIVGNVYSGVCSKHQRRLTKAIKRARHLGLLPFSSSM
jgi:small subunit ribosomal protein S18